MIAVYLTTVLMGVASAVLPVVPMEPYLIGVVATTSANPIVCGVAAGVGQTAGKLLLFLGARGVLRSRLLRRRTTTSRLLARLDQPRWTVPIVLVSAVAGVPPLLATSLYVARTKISPVVFGVACLAGRSLRFVLIAVAPGLVVG